MGTFHDGRGDLHGITVLVQTSGPQVWAGRCDTMEGGRIVLLGADLHTEGEGVMSRAEWVRRTAMVGVQPRHDRVVLALDDVASVRRLSEIEI